MAHTISKADAAIRRDQRAREEIGEIRWPNYRDPRFETGMLSRENYAARRLQAKARSYLVRVRYANTAYLLSRLQACGRRKFVSRWYARVHASGRLLVSFWLVRKVRRKYLAKKRAVITLQAFWRGHCAREAIKDGCKAQIRIARSWRALMAMLQTRKNVAERVDEKVLRDMLECVAASRIQAIVRGRQQLMRLNFEEVRRAVITIQKNARKWQVIRALKKRRLDTMEAVFRIKMWYERWKARRVQLTREATQRERAHLGEEEEGEEPAAEKEGEEPAAEKEGEEAPPAAEKEEAQPVVATEEAEQPAEKEAQNVAEKEEAQNAEEKEEGAEPAAGKTEE